MKKENKINNVKQYIEHFDDDVCNIMCKYVNMENFFDDKETEEKFDYYINGLKGLILDVHKVKYQHTTKISGNGEEYQTLEANADLEAQDYDVFGENKI